MKQEINSSIGEIIIYKSGKGIILREKALIAYNKMNNKIIAFGNEAETVDTSVENVECISPFSNGKVTDKEAAERIVKLLMKKALKSSLIKPRVALCVPKLILSEEEKLTYVNMMYNAGAKDVAIYLGRLEEALEEHQENEIFKNYKVIVAITADNKVEAVEELLQSVWDRVAKWGVSKEQMIEIVEKTCS